MFNTVYFNTKEKMEKCFSILNKDSNRHAHCFYLIEPKYLVKEIKYMVHYISK